MKANDIKDLEGVGKVAWGFISALYKSYWDHFIADKNNFSFRYKVKAQFNPQINRDITPKKDKETDKLASIYALPPPILAKFLKEVVEILKFFKKNPDNKEKKLYAQASSTNSNIARETLKIKKAFPNLQNKKIENIQKMISSESKLKPRLNMTIKRLLRKQVIITMSLDNANKFINNLSSHVTNINRALKNIKSDIMADFICIKNRRAIITTNKIVKDLDLQIIEKYVKNTNNIEANQVEIPRLPQSKLFLKIIGIPYILETTHTPTIADMIEKIIKENHIFNNVVLTSRSSVIKVSPKSDMLIMWINIWNTQSSVKAKNLINQCFNVGSYITIIHKANMNLGVLQYKNCWK